LTRPEKWPAGPHTPATRTLRTRLSGRRPHRPPRSTCPSPNLSVCASVLPPGVRQQEPETVRKPPDGPQGGARLSHRHSSSELCVSRRRRERNPVRSSSALFRVFVQSAAAGSAPAPPRRGAGVLYRLLCRQGLPLRPGGLELRGGQ